MKHLNTKKLVVFYQVLHVNGNFLRLVLDVSNNLKWKTLKVYRSAIEKKPRAVGMLVSELFLRQVILTLSILYISFSILF